MFAKKRSVFMTFQSKLFSSLRFFFLFCSFPPIYFVVLEKRGLCSVMCELCFNDSTSYIIHFVITSLFIYFCLMKSDWLTSFDLRISIDFMSFWLDVVFFVPVVVVVAPQVGLDWAK